MAIYWKDGKLFRLGECTGRNKNLAIWAKKGSAKAGFPNDLILREQGKRKGGRRAMASMRLSYRRKGAIRFALDGAKINASG